MDIDIKNKFENIVLNRTEVDFIVSFVSSTPSRAKIVETLAALLNAKKELIILQYIKGEYGKKEAKARAHVYNDEAVMKDIEKRHLIERMKPTEKEEKKEEKTKEKPKKEEKPKEEIRPEEEKKEEKPEEKKEEKKEEKPAE